MEHQFDENWYPIPARPAFEVKDSGAKAKYEDGMQRDTSAGKPQFPLMFPKGVPYEEQLMTRVAMHYHQGGVKYGARNWEKSSTEDSLAHHEDALMRHVVKFLLGVDDGEDHAAAVVWNVNAVDLTRRNIKAHTEQNEKEIDRALGDVTLGTDPKYVGPEYLVWKAGDDLTDNQGSCWVWDGQKWQSSSGRRSNSVVKLAREFGPLHVQSGSFHGLNISPDGQFSWE
jgi:hypothetical protein